MPARVNANIQAMLTIFGEGIHRLDADPGEVNRRFRRRSHPARGRVVRQSADPPDATPGRPFRSTQEYAEQDEPPRRSVRRFPRDF